MASINISKGANLDPTGRALNSALRSSPLNTAHNITVIDDGYATIEGMYSMFQMMLNIVNLDLSRMNTTNVTNMWQMFYRCQNLTNLDVSSFDTSNVTNMREMFYRCQNLINVDVSNWDTSKVKDMSNMFNGCTNLTDLDLSNWSTEGIEPVKTYGGLEAFVTNCYSLKTLNVAGMKFHNMVNIGDSAPVAPFYNLPSLQYFDMSNTTLPYTLSLYPVWGVTTHFITNTPNLTDIKADDVDATYLRSSSNLFGSNGANKVANISANNWRIGNTAASLFSYLPVASNLSVHNWDVTNCTDLHSLFQQDPFLKSLDLSDWKFGTTSKNMHYMFDRDTNLHTITFPNTEKIKINSVIGMFGNCPNLKNLDVSHFDTSDVTNAQEVFYNDRSLKTLDVTDWNTSNMTNLWCMFWYCSNLTDLNLSNWDTSNVKNMTNMFYQCANLTSLDSFNLNTSNVMYASYAFAYTPVTDNILNNLEFPNYNGGTLTATFQGCQNLIHGKFLNNTNAGYQSTYYACLNLVDFIDPNHKVRYVDRSTFASCRNLVTVNLSNTVTNRPENIEFASVFSDDNNLLTVDFSYSNAQIISMDHAFYGCQNLQVLNVSNSNLEFKDLYMREAFRGVSNIQTIDLSNTIMQFTGTNRDSNAYNNTYRDMANVVKNRVLNLQNATFINKYGFSFSSFNATEINADGLTLINVSAFPAMTNTSTQVYSLTNINMSESNITSFTNTFFGTMNLTHTIDLNELDFSQAKNYYAMFFISDVDKFLNLNSLIFDNVVNTGYMFSSTIGDKLVLSDKNMENVTSVGYMFGPSSINNITLSNIVFNSLTNASYMFPSSRTSTLSFTNVDFPHVTNASFMFSQYGMDNTPRIISDLYLPNCNDFRSFSTTTVSMSDRSYVNCDFGSKAVDINGTMMFRCENSGTYSEYGSLTFDNCVFGSFSNTPNMFVNCKGLVNAPYVNTANCTDMTYMFYQCINLTDVPEYDMSNVTSTVKMYSFCNKLSDSAIQNIINSCLNATTLASSSKNLSNANRNSIFNSTNITSSRYANRLDELTAAGWSY